MVKILRINSEEMPTVNENYKAQIDKLPEKNQYYIEPRISNTNAFNYSTLNAEIADYIIKTNSEIRKTISSAKSLVNDSKNYVEKISQADGKAVFPAELPNNVTDFKTITELYGNCWYNNSSLLDQYDRDKNYFGTSYIGTMDLSFVNGNPQGFTEATDSNGNRYLVVTSHQGGYGYVYIVDALTGNVVKTYAKEGEHFGSVLFSQDGKLLLPVSNSTTGIISYNFDEMLNDNNNESDGRTITNMPSNKTLIDNESFGATIAENTASGNNSSASISYMGFQSDGSVGAGLFVATQESQFSNNGNANSSVNTFGFNSDGLSFTGNYTSTTDALSRGNASGTVNMTELQGMCSMESFGQNQTLFTSSYYANGNRPNSQLFITTTDTTTNTYNSPQTSLTLPSGAEQITPLSDGNYAIVFEGMGDKGDNRRLVIVGADYFLNDQNRR